MSTLNPPSTADGALQSLTRLVRQICLLSEQGDDRAAEHLERTQLADAVRDYRFQRGPGALPEEALAEMFVAEQKRAADAVALAELLIPQLSGRPAGRRQTAAPAEKAIPLSGELVAPRPDPRRRPLPSAAGIPGFLDEMLAGDTVRRRST